MLASIHPLGERARGNRWGVTAGAYIVAATAAGGALGVALALAGWGGGAVAGRSTALALGVAAVACALAAVFDANKRLRLPTVGRQVNEDWLNRYRGWVYGAGFGAQLGLGVVTIVTTAAIYLLEVLTLIAGWITSSGAAAAALGAVIGATFGLARALPLLLGSTADRPDRLRALHRRLARADVTARALTIASVVVAGAVLLVAATT